MHEFDDRVDAGRRLADRLVRFLGTDAVVLGLPRGGVPVAFEVADALGLPLDVIVVRKLGMPSQPEVAMGAIGEGGTRVIDPEVVGLARLEEGELEAIEDRERAVLESRVERLRRGRERVALDGRIAIVVDDGVATGSTARAACEVARRLGAARVVLAVPVGPRDTAERVSTADEVECLLTPAFFTAVGMHYRDFSATSDDEVLALLELAAR